MKPQPLAQPQRRAVIYLRQSTYREESISLELQETAAREHAARQGYVVVAVEQDAGISGRTWKRPAVVRVMKMIEDREADVVVLWKWSRLSRRRLDWAVALDKIESAGGLIESATEPADTTTSAGRFQRGVLAEVAAMESERIGEMWKETLQRRIRSGVPGTGGDRYGYIRVTNDTYEPDPSTAPVVAEAYRRYVEDEWGWTRLVRWLNGAGYTTITGAIWRPDKLRAVLDAGFAAGVLATGYRTGKLTYLPGNQPPIIDRSMWDAYLARRALAPRPAATVEPKSPLSGLMRCADCGSPMRSISRSANVRGYGCSGYLDQRNLRYVTCSQHGAEEAVRAWIRDLADDINELAAVEAKTAARRVTSINDASAIDAQIRKRMDDLGILTIRYSKGEITALAYELAAPRIEAEIESLRARERETGREAHINVDTRALIMSLAEDWDDLDNLERRTILSKLVKAVLVIPPRDSGRGRVTFRVVQAWDN